MNAASYQDTILECFDRASEISTTNLMRDLRQRFRAMIPLEAIQADCERLASTGKLSVRVKGKGKYWSVNQEAVTA